MSRVTVVVLAAVVWCAVPMAAFAKDQQVQPRKKATQASTYQPRTAGTVRGSGSPWTRERGWANRASGKLLFGLKNVLLGWTEPFTRSYEAGKRNRRIVPGALGFLEGVGYGVIDTIGGAQHVLTFPVTRLDIPLPEGGVKLL